MKRMGCGDRDDIAEEAKELLRQAEANQNILSLQSTVGASATALSVVALNLATDNSDIPPVNKIEIRDVAKMAGISKAKYANFFRGVEKELGLSRAAPTVEEVTVRLGLPQVSKRANRMLKVYQEEFLRALPESRRADVNFDRALYPCAAVSAAAKAQKVSLDRRKLLEECGGERKAAVEKLVREMTEAVEKHDSENSKLRGEKSKKSVADTIIEKENSVIGGKKAKLSNVDEEFGFEEFDPVEYNAWKQRMLRAAGLIET